LDSLRLEWVQREGRGCVRIQGLSARLLARLRELGELQLGRMLRWVPDESSAALGSALRPLAGPASAAPPAVLAGRGLRLEELPLLAGRWVADAESLWFVPRFPLLPRTRYALWVDASLGDGKLEALACPGELGAHARLRWALPDVRPSPETRVVEIYPTCGELPANQLRLYVHFSSPMSEGFARRRVRLLQADAEEATDEAFLDMEPELWDPERRRLTLLFDPGRLKRGLVPNREIGYPLREGRAVRVVVDEEFRDQRGEPLLASFARGYRVGPELRRRPSAADWRFEHPAAGTLQPLAIRFDRPLDHGLLQHCIRVLDRDRRPVAGELAIPPGEMLWQFTPRAPWAARPHLVRIDSRLEDLAGNSLSRPFDRDLSRPEDAPLGIDALEHPFTCEGPA
jgi:hypothetical protein